VPNLTSTSNVKKSSRIAKASHSSSAFDAANRGTHARLLSAFLALSSIDVGLDPRLEPVTGEPLESVFDRWIKAGVLKRADAIAAISKYCSNDELTLRLREIGVNAKGTKEVLAGRLLDNDPDFARLRFPEAYCAPTGNIVRDVGVAIASAPRVSSRSVLQCLRDRDVEAAIERMIELRVNDPSWTAPATWQVPRYLDEMTPLLRRIFTAWPNALDPVPDGARGTYRIAAAMMALHESPCSPDWIDAKGPTRLRMTGEQIARMLLRAAQHDMRRERWREAGITHVAVIFSHAPCAACSKLQGRVHNLRGLPLLPLRNCTCEGGYSGHMVAYRKSKRSETSTNPRNFAYENSYKFAVNRIV